MRVELAIDAELVPALLRDMIGPAFDFDDALNVFPELVPVVEGDRWRGREHEEDKVLLLAGVHILHPRFLERLEYDGVGATGGVWAHPVNQDARPRVAP